MNKGTQFNTAVVANEDIFSTAIVPSNLNSTFRIYASFNISGVLSVRRTKGETTVEDQLNSGVALAANAAYIFDVLVEAAESINLRYSANGNILALKVFEVQGVTS